MTDTTIVAVGPEATTVLVGPVSGPQGPAGPAAIGSVTDASVSATAAIAESKLALASDAAAGVASRRTLGTAALQAAAGNDARLSDQRTDDIAPLAPFEVVAQGTDPTIIDVVNGEVWGFKDSALWRSTDSARTWTNVVGIGSGSTPGGLRMLADGEVLLVRYTNGLYRSSGWAANPATATWTLVLAPPAGAYFLPWSVDVQGSKVIATDYASSPRDPSRFVHLSIDNGQTFTVVLDLNILYPNNNADVHWHAVCIDPWAEDRLWASNGDGPRAVRYSDDDGATWTTVSVDDIHQPTTLTATEEGIICGTDRVPDGLWLIRRSTMSFEHISVIRFPAASLVGYATRGFRDPVTGVTYVSFLSVVDGLPAVVLASRTGRAGNEVARVVPTGATRAKVNNVVVDAHGYLLAPVDDAGTLKVLRGQLRAGSGVPEDSLNSGGVLRGSAERLSVAAGGQSQGLAASVVVGVAATSTEKGVAVGYVAAAAGVQSVAVGYLASAAGATCTVVGSGAAANLGTQAVAVGVSAAAGARSVAVGETSVSLGADAVAVGRAASTGSNSSAIAVGAGATVTGSNGVAVGTSSLAQASAVAIGLVSVAVTNAVAIGREASAGHSNSVALGRLSVTTAADQVKIGVRHIEYTELAVDPEAPAANSARLYARDNGAGKTQLCVRFLTGAVQVLATEP